MSTGERTGFRPEIEGLRSLAVLTVVVYHVFLDKVSGGVDIFLMLSAFLLTLSFVRKVEDGRPLRLGRHWLHRFKRLLPAAAVTILGTLVAVWAFVPPTRWATTVEQAWASLLYVQNWLLAATSVDYYARDDSLASPLQHFWSLSIQGQVFILWPLLFATGAWLARRSGASYRGVLWLLFGAVFVASLAFSVRETAASQTFAYFDSRTRLWEFAAGTLLALGISHLHPTRPVRVVMGWTGVAAIFAVGLVVPVAESFPGYIALWPIVAASLVVVAGRTGSPLGVDRLLTSRTLVGLGRSSYALYLVHWPILVVYLTAVERPKAGVAAGLVIIASSIVLAQLVTRFVEAPLRRSTWAELRPLHMGAVTAASMLVVAVPTAAWQVQMEREAAAAPTPTRTDHPGARVLRPGFEYVGDPDAPTIPLPTATIDDRWAVLEGGPCTGPFASPDPAAPCEQSTPLDSPERLIAVVGDSHAEQLMAALEPVAKHQNWQVVALLKGACPFTYPEAVPADDECRPFLAGAWEYLLAKEVDAVFTVATAATGGPDERLVTGYERMVDEMTAAGIEVVGVRDNPRFERNVYECAVEHGPDDPACSHQLEDVLAPVNPAQRLAGKEGLYLIDLTDRLCVDGVCPPVIGNVYVYLDEDHLSEDYAKTLYLDLGERLLDATGW